MTKPITALAVVLGLAAGGFAGSQAAWAAQPILHRQAATPMFRHGRRTVSYQQRGVTTGPRAAVVQRAANVDDEAGAPSHRPGMFKTHNTAGWGVADGQSQAAVGFYRRPEQPGIPGPQMDGNEGRGAAGLSFAMKLGG
ncbi:MAG TPA: hypothetical protein VIJ94_07620 [Caulobacteraceae bacterium]